jgi:hypothetical protein
VLDAHERTAVGSEEKLCVDEGTEQGDARRFIEAPEPACLSLGKAQTRHLHEFALDPSQHFVVRSHRL